MTRSSFGPIASLVTTPRNIQSAARIGFRSCPDRNGENKLSRREILAALGALPAADIPTPGALYAQAATELPRRVSGRTGKMVAPLVLGGQAALQWTKPGIDAPDIIARAVQPGLKYLDTSNAYGPSQARYGEAFQRMRLAPHDPDYNARLRQSLFLNSKTAAPPGPQGSARGFE